MLTLPCRVWGLLAVSVASLAVLCAGDAVVPVYSKTHCLCLTTCAQSTGFPGQWCYTSAVGVSQVRGVVVGASRAERAGGANITP